MVVSDDKAMSDLPGPPDYSHEDIRLLRQPEIEQMPHGSWKSRWQLELAELPSADQLRILAQRLNRLQPGMSVNLTPLTERSVRLNLVLPVHPLEVEAFPLIDDVLLAIDSSTTGITEINSSPRDWWRTFRNRSHSNTKPSPI